MQRTRILAALVTALALVACGADDTGAPIDADPPATEEPGDEETTDEGAPPADDAEAEEDEERAVTDDPPERVEPDPPDDPHGATGVPADLDAQVEAAVADLATLPAIDPDDITVVTAEAVTWPDGAIGCPQPDQMYTMALVDGYRIVLEAGGQRFHYHGEDGAEPFHCPNPSEPAGGREATS